MRPNVSAAMRATIITAIAGLLMLVPPIHVLVLIFAMLPLWVISDMGVPGLGHPVNGFFVPSAVGWLLIAGAFWGVCYVLSRRAIRDAADRKQAGASAGP